MQRTKSVLRDIQLQSVISTKEAELRLGDEQLRQAEDRLVLGNIGHISF